MSQEDVVKFVGVKEMLQILKDVEPETYKKLRANIRQISAPAVSAIKTTVPAVAPLSGMIHNGRTAWSPPKVTVSITPNQRSRAFGSTTSNLAAILTRGQSGQALVISDMAGKGGGRQRQIRTRPYPYKGGTRTHRINGQGQKFISALPKTPSRFVYPAIERQLPAIRSQVAITIEEVAKSINARISRI